jgi:hypothetical protein
MLPHEMFIGVAAGLILSALLRFTPTWRELLTAAVAAVLIDFAINSPALRRLIRIAATQPGEISGHPHVCPCLALAFICVLAVLHVLRTQDN